MVKRDNNSILSKFISREVEAIYEKYRNIMEDEINLVAKFIKKLEEGKVDFYYPYLEYASTKALAESLADEDNVDISKLK